MKDSNELGTKSIGKLLLSFSIPAIVGLLVNALYSVVDRIFVGRGVGSLALSGVAITFPISNIIMAFGMLVGTGGAAVVSIKLGQNKKAEAEKILGNALYLSVILSVVLGILGIIFINPILNLLGANPEILPYAKKFAVIILGGAVLQNAGFGMNPIIRSEGNPKKAMMTMLIGAILNLIMNPIFIFIFKLGVMGSALATVISQAVCSIWVISYFSKGNSVLKLRKVNLRLEKKVVNEIVGIGMSPFAMQIAASLVTITFNTSLEKYGGNLSIAAYSIISSIILLLAMPIIGITQGAQPIIGYNYGAKEFSRVKKTLKLAVISATCISTMGFVVAEIFPEQIIRIFNTDAELIAIGADGISKVVLAFAFVGSQIVFTNFFQAIGKAKHSMFLSLARQIIFLIPLLHIMSNAFGLQGIWFANPISDLASFIASLILIIIEMKNFNKFSKEEKITNIA